MALKKCKECGEEVNTKTKSCPHCGAKQKSVSDLGSTLTGAAAMTAAEAAEDGVLNDLWESIVDSLF